MSFTSAAFLILFFPVCVLGNYFINEKYRNTFLCLASLVFYAWCGIRFLILLTLLTALDYGFGLVFEREESRSLKKTFLTVALAINIGTLCYYKYLFDILTTITSWIPVGGGVHRHYGRIAGIAIGPVVLYVFAHLLPDGCVLEAVSGPAALRGAVAVCGVLPQGGPGAHHEVCGL